MICLSSAISRRDWIGRAFRSILEWLMLLRTLLLSLSLVACGPSADDDAGDGGGTTAAGSGTGPTTTTMDSGTDQGTAADGTGTTGAVEPEEPPPGDPGGLCVQLGAMPACTAEGAVCNVDDNYCYLPDTPCEGFACGGAERGTCAPQAGLPSCTCADGFENETFALYCCPLAGDDPYCPA
jgi:hypothetical protein